MVRRSPGGPARLFLLERFQVFGDGIEPDFSPVLVGFDLMEDWSPNGHLATAVGGLGGLLSLDDLLDLLVRKLPAISRREQG